MCKLYAVGGDFKSEIPRYVRILAFRVSQATGNLSDLMFISGLASGEKWSNH